MQSLKMKSAIFAGLIMMAPLAQANDWYAGIGFGNTSFNSEEIENAFNSLGSDIAFLNSLPGVSASLELDDEDSGLKIFGGYIASENLAVEFGYADLGEIKADFSLIDNGTFSGDPSTTLISSKDSVSGLYVAAIGKMPLSETVSLNGRLGLYLWDIESDFSATDTTGFFGSGSESWSDSGEDLFYGVGLNIGWFGLFYDVYDIDGDDVDFIGASLQFNLQ